MPTIYLVTKTIYVLALNMWAETEYQLRDKETLIVFNNLPQAEKAAIYLLRREKKDNDLEFMEFDSKFQYGKIINKEQHEIIISINKELLYGTLENVYLQGNCYGHL